MENEHSVIHSTNTDKKNDAEELKYDVFRFSLDSIDLSLVEIGSALTVQVRK